MRWIVSCRVILVLRFEPRAETTGFFIQFPNTLGWCLHSVFEQVETGAVSTAAMTVLEAASLDSFRADFCPEPGSALHDILSVVQLCRLC